LSEAGVASLTDLCVEEAGPGARRIDESTIGRGADKSPQFGLEAVTVLRVNLSRKNIADIPNNGRDNH